MEDFYDSVPQHRGHGSHLRRHHGREVRPFGLPVDCPGVHLRRCRSRLFERHAVRPPRRSGPARAGRRLPWRAHKEGDARILGVPPAHGRGCVCVQSGAHPRRPLRRFAHLGVCLVHHNLHLLLPRNDAANRQNHRQDIPVLRHRHAVHGRRADGCAVCQVAVAA